MGQAALVLGGYGFAVYQDSFDPRVEVALSFAHPETILPTIRRVSMSALPLPFYDYRLTVI